MTCHSDLEGKNAGNTRENEQRDVTISPPPAEARAEASNPRIAIISHFEERWFQDVCKEAEKEHDQDARRRQILFATCGQTERLANSRRRCGYAANDWTNAFPRSMQTLMARVPHAGHV